MTKLYTKSGDAGTSGLFGGKRLPKHDVIFASLGTVDELNAILGVAASKTEKDEIKQLLMRVQSELFTIGALLATPADSPVADKISRLMPSNVSALESEIDGWTEQTPELHNFILPGGDEAAAQIFWARAVARRAERQVNELSDTTLCFDLIRSYLNRLSDWLFAMARYLNHATDTPEVVWDSE